MKNLFDIFLKLLRLIGFLPASVVMRVPVQGWIADEWSFPVYDGNGTRYGPEDVESAMLVRMRGLPLYNHRETHHPDDLLIALLEPSLLVRGSVEQIKHDLGRAARRFARAQFERRVIRRGVGESACYRAVGYGRDAYGYIWVEGPLEFQDEQELRSIGLDQLDLAETFRRYPLPSLRGFSSHDAEESSTAPARTVA